jgi:hypothetical protein
VLLSFGASTCCGGESVAVAEISVPATNLLAVVSERYAAITNLACVVRRQIAGGDEESVSRIVFARGGRLNAEMLSPDRRRVIVDGESAWTKKEKDKKPHRVAFDKQSPAQKASVLCVPASPEEVLFTLDPASGIDLADPTSIHARQVKFRIRGDALDSQRRALVSVDEVGRIRAVNLFADANCRWRIASYAWDLPTEVLPGVWLFGRSSVETAVNGTPVTLTTRFDNLRVNQDLAPELFNADKAFDAKAKK